MPLKFIPDGFIDKSSMFQAIAFFKMHVSVCVQDRVLNR